MANINEMTTGLKYQIGQFLTHIKSTYTSAADDVTVANVWYAEPFDPTNEDSLKSLIAANNYGFVISNVVCAPSNGTPIRYVRNEYSAEIHVIRRTLQSKDITNKTNLVLQGGSDGASADITSMSKICGDMCKWFSTQSQGGKLTDSGSTVRALASKISAIGELQNTGSFYFKTLSFEALSMESTTISAS